MRGEASPAPPGKGRTCGPPSRLPGKWLAPRASVQASSEPSELTEDEIFSKQPAWQLLLPRISDRRKAEFCVQKQNVSLPGEPAQRGRKNRLEQEVSLLAFWAQSQLPSSGE